MHIYLGNILWISLKPLLCSVKSSISVEPFRLSDMCNGILTILVMYTLLPKFCTCQNLVKAIAK